MKSSNCVAKNQIRTNAPAREVPDAFRALGPVRMGVEVPRPVVAGALEQANEVEGFLEVLRAEAEVLPKYRARAKEAALNTELHAQYPGLIMDEDSPAVLLARELTGANQVEAVSYGTEAGHFQNYGIPAVICGPGSIDQAHRADEFCELSELVACENFLRKVIAKASA